MKISSIRFHQVFERVRALQFERNRDLVKAQESNPSSFDVGEDYKQVVRAIAFETLDPKKWSRKSIGEGQILERVIRAIEVPLNNLVYWHGRKGPASRAHLHLLNVKPRTETCRSVESTFYELFKQRRASREIFDALVGHCKRRYDLLAFFFFVLDPARFLPIKTTFFDKALGELGLELRTEGRCSWDNYQEYLAAMRAVQSCLRSEGIVSATLLDAHSFCWVLGSPDMLAADSPEIGAVRAGIFEGRLLLAPSAAAFTANDDAQVRKSQEAAARRAAAGAIAEEIVLECEIKRLREAGRLELADKVEDVSDRPGLGYDIQSFELDGSKRYIEVKNVSNGNRFFLSAWELQNSRGRANYWFGLVRWDAKKGAEIEFLEASRVGSEHLQPVEFLVQFDREH